MNLRAQSHRSGLPGLLLCGDSIFPGQGAIGVTLSGINAAWDATRYVRGMTRQSRSSTAAAPAGLAVGAASRGDG